MCIFNTNYLQVQNKLRIIIMHLQYEQHISFNPSMYQNGINITIIDRSVDSVNLYFHAIRKAKSRNESTT